MKRTYSKYACHVIVEKNEKFGIEDNAGNLLLPIEYDSIFLTDGIKDGVGFILCKNGRFGYVEFEEPRRCKDDVYVSKFRASNGCATAFLPCVYNWIEGKRNGLVIHCDTVDAQKEFWYDFKSKTLHRDLMWVDNFTDYDSFLIDGIGDCMPMLKRAGEDAWVKIPRESSVDPWRALPLDHAGVRCVLCMEEIPHEDERGDQLRGLYNYFFLLLFKNGWTFTPSRQTLAELYADMPAIVEGLNRRKDGNDEGQIYSLFCKYKRQYEDWD